MQQFGVRWRDATTLEFWLYVLAGAFAFAFVTTTAEAIGPPAWMTVLSGVLLGYAANYFEKRTKERIRERREAPPDTEVTSTND
jgi:hypothetical protein